MNKQSFIEDRIKLEKVAIRLFDTKPKKPYNQDMAELIKQRDQATEALRANMNKIQELNPSAAAQQPKGPVSKPSESVGSRVENKTKAKATPKATPAPKKILLATPVAEAAKAAPKVTPKATPKKMGAGKAGLIGAGLTAGAIGAKKLYDEHQQKKVAFIEGRMILEKIANSAEEKYKAAKQEHLELTKRDFTKNMGAEIGLGVVGGMAGSGVDAVMRYKKGLPPVGGFGVGQLGGTIGGLVAGQSTAKGKEKKKDQKESLDKLKAAKKEWKQSKVAFTEDRMMLGKSAEFWIPKGGGPVRQEDDPQLFKLNDDASQSYANQKTLEKNLEQKQKTDANKGTLIGGASLSTVGSLVGGIKDKKPGAIAGGAVGALTGSILGRMIANESFENRNRAMIDERDESRLVSLEKHNELLGYMDDNGYIVD